MSGVVQTKRVNGKMAFQVIYDDGAESPRKNDPMTEIVAWHKRLAISDHDKYASPDRFRRSIRTLQIVRPLYIMEHGQVGLSLTPYADRWDSGQVGYVRVTPERAEKHGLKIGDVEAIAKRMGEEVEEYSKYLNGNVFAVSAHRMAHGDVLPTPVMSIGDVWDMEDDVFDEVAMDLLDLIDIEEAQGITEQMVKDARWEF